MRLPTAALLPWVLLLGILLPGTPLQARAEEPWVVVQSAHVTAYSDSGAEATQELIQRFESMRELLRPVFPPVPGRTLPLTLVINRNRASMRLFIPDLFKEKDPYMHGGAFLADAEGAFAFIPVEMDLTAKRHSMVVLHRYVHVSLRQNAANLPFWLQEAFASLYGHSEFRGAQVLVGQVPMGLLAGLKYRATSLLPLEDLMTLKEETVQTWTRDQRVGFQLQSWILLHYLLFDPDALKAGLLGSYLKGIRTLKDPGLAARESLGDLNQLKVLLMIYARKRVHTYWTYPLPSKLRAADLQVRPLAEAELKALQARCVDLSTRTVDPCLIAREDQNY